jgi:hypothetical protein
LWIALSVPLLPRKPMFTAFTIEAIGKVIVSAAMTSIRVLLYTVECNTSSDAAGMPVSVLTRLAGCRELMVKLNSMIIKFKIEVELELS